MASCTKAVILARGLGTRMREADESVSLAPAQAAAADTGAKAMMMVGADRPFLDYVLSGLADAGFTDVCLVVAPEHSAIRDYYTKTVRPRRVGVTFAIQQEPVGTANAVLAVEQFAAGEPVVVLNADNYYPVDVLARLRTTDGCAGVAFSRRGLLRHGDIPPERIASFAFLDVSADGALQRIVEKPDARTAQQYGDDAVVSMNCWRLTTEMFRACREVPASSRGEYELPLAVQYAVAELGIRFTMVPADATVLDLSRRGDVPSVAARLADLTVEL